MKKKNLWIEELKDEYKRGTLKWEGTSGKFKYLVTEMSYPHIIKCLERLIETAVDKDEYRQTWIAIFKKELRKRPIHNRKNPYKTTVTQLLKWKK